MAMYTATILVRMPPELRHELELEAAASDRSLSNYIRWILSRRHTPLGAE